MKRVRRVSSIHTSFHHLFFLLCVVVGIFTSTGDALDEETKDGNNPESNRNGTQDQDKIVGPNMSYLVIIS